MTLTYSTCFQSKNSAREVLLDWKDNDLSLEMIPVPTQNTFRMHNTLQHSIFMLIFPSRTECIHDSASLPCGTKSDYGSITK